MEKYLYSSLYRTVSLYMGVRPSNFLAFQTRVMFPLAILSVMKAPSTEASSLSSEARANAGEVTTSS